MGGSNKGRGSGDSGACDFLLSRPLPKTGSREVGRQANRQAEMASEPAFLLCDIGPLISACELR